MSYSFSIEMRQAGEVIAQFVFAAPSEAVLNVWMEVLYVSMGNVLPENDFATAADRAALSLDPQLRDLTSTDTPVPSKAHHLFTKGQGIQVSRHSSMKQTDSGEGGDAAAGESGVPTSAQAGAQGVPNPEDLGEGAEEPKERGVSFLDSSSGRGPAPVRLGFGVVGKGCRIGPWR